MRIYTKDDNNGVNVFVFGSNEGGYHGAGAALIAKRDWGAIQGISYGPQGQAFGIPTKSETITTLPLERIEGYVKAFLLYAKYSPDKVFLVTRIGCGFAGYKDSDIAPMFKDAPNNCRLPDEWTNLLGT